MSLGNKPTTLYNSATLCYQCKANWFAIVNRNGKIFKECRRPWWKFWQWHCGAVYLLDEIGNSTKQ